MVSRLTAIVLLGVMACASGVPAIAEPVSIGTTDRGHLHRPEALSNRGEGFVRLRVDDARFGTTTLLAAIRRAAQIVAVEHPGGYPLVVGDLSGPYGGAHPRHRSHRTGRDADLAYFVRDAGGIAQPSKSWVPFDRFGVATRADGLVVFDEARNWALVRALLMDPDAGVKWIFCSNDIKARLLRYAAEHESSAQAVFRATWVLHEPARGDPHADHFHVRVGCGAAERTLGCREQPPFWPWLADAASKHGVATTLPASDVQLVDWLFAQQHANEPGYLAGRTRAVASQPAAISGRDVD